MQSACSAVQPACSAVQPACSAACVQCGVRAGCLLYSVHVRACSAVHGACSAACVQRGAGCVQCSMRACSAGCGQYSLSAAWCIVVQRTMCAVTTLSTPASRVLYFVRVTIAMLRNYPHH